MATGFAAIGHSNRSLDEFMETLPGAQIDLLMEVRAFPRSRSNPAFNTDRLPLDLTQAKIGDK